MDDKAKEIVDCLTGKPIDKGGVFAVGNFDGVHVGHRAVLAQARKEARARKVPMKVLTFEPHPYALFRAEGGAFRITPPTNKAESLIRNGADAVVTLCFTKAFSERTPDSFVKEVLIEGCGADHVVVGFDFVFGCGRGGDRESLCRNLKPYGIEMTEVPPCRDKEGEIISSSRIRAFIKQGKMQQAAALLGQPYTFEGIVQQGDQRGRQLGFPTANMALGDFVRPLYGPYVVCARKKGSSPWIKGVANIGHRPSVDGKTELAEVHLLDFNEDIYGQVWEVRFLHFLRPEKNFASLDGLKDQIAKDAQDARSFFKTHALTD